ncbi:MAG TPA: winged helix-turn-helix domain-containing protein, partial [Woeseiaceae bacterium]|nr:winged helix-turn-helix domain-containing protein [Woeseiaceae bacterium]
MVYDLGGFVLDPRRRSLSRSDGEPIRVTAKAFDTLIYLVEHAGELVSRSEIIDVIWPRTIVEEGNLNQTIYALRRALGDHGGHRYIATVPGRGYQFVAEVQTIRSDPRANSQPDSGPVPAQLAPSPRWSTMALVAGAVIGVSLVGAYSITRTPYGGSQGLAPVSRVSPVTTYPGDELSPSLSPDGRQVVFSW